MKKLRFKIYFRPLAVFIQAMSRDTEQYMRHKFGISKSPLGYPFSRVDLHELQAVHNSNSCPMFYNGSCKYQGLCVCNHKAK